MEDELFVTDLILEAANALKNNDFREVKFARTRILNHYLDIFVALYNDNLFFTVAKQAGRNFNYHDVYKVLRYIAKKMYWYGYPYDYLSPLCIE